MLTPLDIENKKFSKQMMNGYNVSEVDDFLDEIMVEYAKVIKENSELKEDLEKAKESVEQYKTIENTLQNTLVMAQTTAENVQSVARQEAEQILKDAETEAKKAVMEIEQQITLKEKELENTKKQFDVYKAKMESLLISQLEILKEIKEE